MNSFIIVYLIFSHSNNILPKIFFIYHPREKLRDVIAPLQYRKAFKSKITSTLGVVRKRPDNEEKTLIEQFNEKFLTYKQKVTELKEYQRGNENLSGLWASDIKKIEGKYGSGVGTYFRFLRSLLFLNIFISTIR